MVDVRITLSGLWIAVMLTYLLGDVLRGFAGHVVPGEIQGKAVSQVTWVLIAAIMLVPIVMLVLSLTLPYPSIRWVTLVAAAGSVIFNLAGLPYEGAYDNFLIGVSVVLCGLIGWYAWTWPTSIG
ncbi:MAG: hypothetical protein Q7W51_04720 [Coriobacteriia bacterium]|nr:hypothetical protein [Coriobacteriia bacterium]